MKNENKIGYGKKGTRKFQTYSTDPKITECQSQRTKDKPLPEPIGYEDPLDDTFNLKEKRDLIYNKDTGYYLEEDVKEFIRRMYYMRDLSFYPGYSDVERIMNKMRILSGGL